MFSSLNPYELLIQAVVDYAIYMLDPDGRIVSWNPGAERIKGYTAEEIIGDHFSRFYTEEERAAGVPARSLRLAAETGRFSTEGWRCRKDGSRFWAMVVIDPIHQDGKLIGFAKITRDMTEQRSSATGSAGERAPLPSAGRGRDRLRHLHAQPGGTRHQLERRGRAHQGLHRLRDHRRAFFPLLHPGGCRHRPAREGACCSPARGALRG